MAKVACIICSTPCTWCVWRCKCWLDKHQVMFTNSIVELDKDVLQDIDKVKIIIEIGKTRISNIEQTLRILSWEEDMPLKYVATIEKRKIEVDSNYCVYEQTWVWSRCIKCWEAKFYWEWRPCKFINNI